MFGVDEIAVVRQGQRALGVIDQAGLGVHDFALPCGGITVVSQRHVTGQTLDAFGAEYIRH